METIRIGKDHPGVFIKQLIRRSGCTQKQIASKLNISLYRLKSFISGEKALDTEMALRLAFLFKDVSAEEFLYLQIWYDLEQALQTGLVYTIEKELFSSSEQTSQDNVAIRRKGLNHAQYRALNHIVTFLQKELPNEFGNFMEDLTINDICKLKLREGWPAALKFARRLYDGILVIQAEKNLQHNRHNT